MARYGGEEFVVLLPNTDTEHACNLAEIIRTKIEKLAIPAADTVENKFVTISLGCASVIPDFDLLAEDLVLAADRAMYRAKKAGKNRIKAGEIARND